MKPIKKNIKITRIKVGSGGYGSYSRDHSSDDCDKCLERVGKKNLYRVPFLYKDMNDHVHEDVSWMLGYYREGYRQYYVCKNCYSSVDKFY